MKTSEEIKTGLEGLKFIANAGRIDDALEYIQQLEEERDAAVALIPRACGFCKWYGTKHGGFHPDCKNPNGCRNISGINTGWEWRGVQKEGPK